MPSPFLSARMIHTSCRILAQAAFVAALCTTMAAPAQIAVHQAPAEREPIFLGVRVLKAPGVGDLAWTVTLPPDCTACRLVLNAASSGQNAKEFFFHLLVPPSATAVGPVRIRVDPQAVRAVLLSRTDADLPKRAFARPEARAIGAGRVPYRRTDDGIALTLPTRPRGISVPPDDLGDVTEDYTYIETPGVYIRIGHADPARRRGAYATGRWPALEARAALNLEFAAREAIVALHLDRDLRTHGVQTIMLMNFDTNYPTLGPDEAHPDSPPHWHMHLYWRIGPKVRKVGHFQIRPDGLLAANISSDLKSLAGPERTTHIYAQGQADETRTPDGRLLYAQTITRDGFFVLSSTRAACQLSPISGGFDSGVVVACDGAPAPIRVQADDDPALGRVRLRINGQLSAVYDYDVDTGELIAHEPQPAMSRVRTISSGS